MHEVTDRHREAAKRLWRLGICYEGQINVVALVLSEELPDHAELVHRLVIRLRSFYAMAVQGGTASAGMLQSAEAIFDEAAAAGFKVKEE